MQKNKNTKRRHTALIILIILLLFLSSVILTLTANDRLYPAKVRLVGGFNYGGGNDGADIVENGSMNNPQNQNADLKEALTPSTEIVKWLYLTVIALALIVIAMIIILVPKNRK